MLHRAGGGVDRRHQAVDAVLAIHAEIGGQRRLQVEAHAVELARGAAVQRLAHGQQQLAGGGQPVRPRRAAGDRLHPGQPVQVPQPADVVLEVGRERPAGTLDLPVPGGGGVEDAPGELAPVALEPAPAPREQLLELGRVAGHQAGREQCGRRRQVAPGELHRLLGRADGVADLEAGVPQRVEQRAQGMVARLAGAVAGDEQQVDVGVG